ncbi:MAG: hypothetical protein EAZ78_10460 [Oscillatoriales cyanobacterium]|nr:MAG: hypothetical protein EA000_08745 [Oscillatoriales cyanobacterium]TAE01353.1 MAG: hypothetical protein EAZ98_03435 [Oscillatoriales cyanobacterium]TAE02606.1 MAG: hypothetical protein EAZ96_15435 [Oscillatoriales cyanobacterium]TAF04023.1 MAG: hypothetical protein EAZ78_10460 [Oscillatoriales cyanobacterium]TAF46492.1 MAG: hypothetical protein EAZ68_03680 [Oscillatoriales cyanobacterium]
MVVAQESEGNKPNYTNLMGRCTDLDPPRIPLNNGNFEKHLVPPLLRGARGDQIREQPHKKLV